MWGLLRLVDQPLNSPYTVSLHFSAVVSPSLVPWIVWVFFFFFLYDSVGVYIMRCSLLVYFQKLSDNIAVDFERTLHGYRGCSHPACWTSVLQSRLLVVCLWENWCEQLIQYVADGRMDLDNPGLWLYVHFSSHADIYFLSNVFQKFFFPISFPLKSKVMPYYSLLERTWVPLG